MCNFNVLIYSIHKVLKYENINRFISTTYKVEIDLPSDKCQN